MNRSGLVAVAAVVYAVLVAVALLLKAGQWSAAHWLFLAAGAVVLAALGVFLWHRRQLAALHEKHAVWVGRYRRVTLAQWPMACRHCGTTLHDWRALRAHDDPDSSSCARYWQHRDAQEMAAESLPMDGWQADVIGKEMDVRESQESQ